jgi:hypothetical protein
LEYINTLISGIVVFRIGKHYIYVKPFSAKDKTFADFFSNEQHDDALIDGIWTQKDAEEHLIQMGYWSDDNEKIIEEIESNIENMKVDYFNHFYNSTTKDYVKKNLEKQKSRYNEILNKRYIFYDKTCEYLKRYSFMSYLLHKNAYLQKNNKPARLLFSTQILYNKYNDVVNGLSQEIRSIAKNDDWRNKWFSLKHEVFSNKPSSFTDFQYSIMSWSNYYDSIYQSMDKPGDDIIDDDIALDGWSIVQRRKRKEEEKKTSAEKMLPDKMKDSGEIFLPAKSKKEASDIMSLNSPEAKARINSLKKDLRENGSMEESQLSSTRLDLQMQSLQMTKENRR